MKLSRLALVLVLALQAGFALQGIANYWQWGHNGFNSSAYQLAAKNTLRWKQLLPSQYVSGYQEPAKWDWYLSAPLALHLLTTASVWMFGDSEVSVRLVPALHGILAVWILFLLVQRHWSTAHALIACLIYILQPFNTALANMSSHITGHFLWSLIMLYCYLEWLRSAELASRTRFWGGNTHGRAWLWIVGVFVAAWMATQWDWPAFYICFFMAVHWFYASFKGHQSQLRKRFNINREHVLLLGYCCLVLASFAGHFLLIQWLVGDFGQIKSTFARRHSTPPDAYRLLWKDNILPMYSLPLICLGLVWIAGLVMRNAQGKSKPRDLVPLSFALAGVIHVLLYKQTALLHIYWSWHLSPFFAIAASSVLCASSQVLAERVGYGVPAFAKRASTLALVAVLGVFAWLYLEHVLPLIPEGRRLAGTYRFANYRSDYHKILFAKQIRRWTTPSTGLLIMEHLDHRVEFQASHDRSYQWQRKVPFKPPARPKGNIDGWVLIGRTAKVTEAQRVRLAAIYPYREYGEFFYVDMRRKASDVQVWKLLPRSASLSWKFWVNAVEPPMHKVRNATAEKRLTDAIAQWKADSTASDAVRTKNRSPLRSPSKPRNGSKLQGQVRTSL